MKTTSAQEAIAILIDLAQQGEIDPWDVQVIEVIDRFLTELGLPHDLDFAYQQANLSQSGQAFLWASRLVLLKADTLEKLETAAAEFEEFPDSEELLGENHPSRLPLYLEQHIRRRTSAPPPHRRRVTLQELIIQIEQIATELENVSSAPASQRSRPQSRRETLQIISELAHQENLTELASQLEQFLQQQMPQLAPNRPSIDLEELLDLWAQFTPSSPGESENFRDRVGVFWALLLLSAQSKVELSQSEFYQDLTIQVL